MSKAVGGINTSRTEGISGSTEIANVTELFSY